jgi:hypothetical protein
MQRGSDLIQWICALIEGFFKIFNTTEKVNSRTICCAWFDQESTDFLSQSRKRRKVF